MTDPGTRLRWSRLAAPMRPAVVLGPVRDLAVRNLAVRGVAIRRPVATRRLMVLRGMVFRGIAVGAAGVMLAGCGLISGRTTLQLDVPDVITVTSPDVSAGVMGSAFTCHGSGKHPGIHWSGAPANTKSVALVMDDSAAPITPYIYWIVFNIGPQTTDIQEGTLPPGARKAHNSKGTVGYDAPCPLHQPHSYRFTVYALGRVLRLKTGASMETAWMSIAQAAIARGRLTVTADP